MNTSTTNSSGTDANQLFGYNVTSSDGNNVGTVDAVWVDDASDRPEFIAVKTGWLFGKNHLMPIEQAQTDSANQTIQVPYSQDQIKNGPSFGTDETLSPGDEQSIYDYYGMQRSTQSSRTGYAGSGTGMSQETGAGTSQGTVGQTDMPTSPSEVDVTAAEEELQVGKRTVQAGEVRLRKVVRTEHKEVPVTLRREDVEVERIPAGEATNATVPDDAFQDGVIDIPVMEEQAVVAKEARVVGGVRVTKGTETETETVGGDVRSTDIEVDEEGNVDATNPRIRP